MVRGTLVYALENFDLTDKMDLIIELVLEGNFEVAHQAVLLTDNIQVAGPEVRLLYLQLLAKKAQGFSETWRLELVNELISMFE